MSTDSAFEALTHEQRRTLLLALLESNPQEAGVASLTGKSELTDAEQREQIEMFHVHLPKLEDYGYIEWNKETDQIIKGPQFDEIRPLLECIASNDAE
ncbi:DUF7344 domain-containing protein [Haloglomus litoreum]|uniref:DUF7344 domain-containing protein n=1 Tax=Haloglomus litoreum TaxID=3034026 RepID=UPI0023E759FC|nr:transcriptional regulator [Haloglomus sp. DT116]